MNLSLALTPYLYKISVSLNDFFSSSVFYGIECRSVFPYTVFELGIIHFSISINNAQRAKCMYFGGFVLGQVLPSKD